MEGLRNFEGGYKATGIIEKLDKRDNASDLYSGEYPVRISAETPTVMIFFVVSVFLGYDPMSKGDWFPTFRDISDLIIKGQNV